MEEKIFFKKVFFLNENIKYPECYKCKKELSPYSITNKNLKKLDTEIINIYLNASLLYLHGINTNIHLIFLCKHCLKGKYIKFDE